MTDLTKGQQERVVHIVQKGTSFETQLGRLETYLKDPKCDSFNAKIRFDITFQRCTKNF